MVKYWLRQIEKHRFISNDVISKKSTTLCIMFFHTIDTTCVLTIIISDFIDISKENLEPLLYFIINVYLKAP